jgi:hypothetical protein
MTEAAYAGRMIAYHIGGDELEHSINVLPIIAGIDDEQTALAFHREAVKHDAPVEVKRAAGEKLRDLS